MSQFDWPGLMRAGMHHLRLNPEAFWALSPAELALMLGQGAGRAPMTRDQLAALQSAYPDSGPVTPSGPGKENQDDNT